VLLAGFALFRVFDVVKPYPAGVLQRLAGGVGVMIDDVVAGLYALLVLLAARALVGWP
jgi:phosphatidylglycerophosphatase A